MRKVEKKIVNWNEEEDEGKAEVQLVPTLVIDKDLSAAREKFAAENAIVDGDDYYDLVSRHPDQRMIHCPAELLLDSEWEDRRGRGYVLGDGSWFDPVNKTFYGCRTED
jgi:hypothetical protein